MGSESILEATAEIRFDIYGGLRGVLFSDNTYLGNESMPSYDNGYYSAGFGFRYKTPIGPIAIDLGFDIQNPTKQYAIHFHIGELF
jgi:translocation and assembly module TamA